MAKLLSIVAVVLSVAVIGLVSPKTAQAQCYAFLDAGPHAWGVEPGCDVVKTGALRPGFIAGFYHPFSFRHSLFDLEAYVSLTWHAPDSWLITGYVGGGYTERAHDWVPSQRVILAALRDHGVTPFISLFTQYTPIWHGQTNDLLVQIKAGIGSYLSDRFLLLGYLTTGWTASAGNYGLAPGVSLIWFI